MGTGSNDVGKAPKAPLSSPPLIPGRPGRNCQGAMSQQGYGFHGNECYPQQLVRLVGYRGAPAKASWYRLRQPVKQAAD